MRPGARFGVLLATGCLLGQAPSASPAVKLPPAHRVRLPQGTLVILAEKRDIPLISFAATLRGGSLTDPAGKEGVASLTAEMLRKGIKSRTAREIADATDGVGAALDTGVGLEVSSVSGEFMSRDQDLMIDLLTNILRTPTFPDSEFAKLKRQSIDAVRSEKDDPNNVLAQYGRSFLFGGHPYGRPVGGDETTLAAITREDIVRSYRANYGGDRLILTMVGDFGAKQMERKLRRAFGNWPKAGGTLPVVEPPRRSQGRRVLLVDKSDATQTYFWLGNLGIANTDRDRDRVDVANTAFGGRFTSMLNTALRIQSGLTYGARSRQARHTLPGPVAITSFTKTETTQRAIDLALETLARFRSAGLDSATLVSVQSYIAGLYPTNLETADQIASRFADLAFYGHPEMEATHYPERVAAVRRAELPSVIARVYPAPEDITMVLIGNAEAIRATAERYGPVSEVRYDDPLLSAMPRASTRAR